MANDKIDLQALSSQLDDIKSKVEKLVKGGGSSSQAQDKEIDLEKVLSVLQGMASETQDGKLTIEQIAQVLGVALRVSEKRAWETISGRDSFGRESKRFSMPILK